VIAPAGLGFGLGLWLAASAAQNGAKPAEIASPVMRTAVASFDFERQGLPVSHWVIEIDQDGTGRYEELSRQEGMSATIRPIRVGASTRRRLDAGLEKVSAGNCETNLKHIAKTGTKKIAYHRGDAWVSCTFDYSDDRGLMDAVSAFQAIAQTLQFGEQLEHSLRFDRLGLDAEMDEVAKETGEGEAIEVENIAPVLQSIVEDDRVMERVRRKAARLLQDAGVAPGPGPVDDSARAEPNAR
jgi:hypothetical protein